jgi:flagellar motility protein MotE (MotC chaperone)
MTDAPRTPVPPAPPVANAAAKAAPPRPAGTKPPAKPGAAPRPLAKRPAKAPARVAAKPRRSLADRVRSARFRLLPVTIFAAVLMLGVRVGDLWRLATHDATLPAFPVSMAQNSPAAPATKDDKAPAKPDEPAIPPAEKPGEKPPERPAAADLPAPVNNEELAKRYAERRADLDRRLKDVEMREALLIAAEKRVEQKVQEMEKVRAQIEQLMKSGEDKQSAQVEALVGIYEKMKPKEAARIFDEMEMPQLLEVLPRMKDVKSALILASMSPVKAKEVTAALLARQAQPALPPVPGGAAAPAP